MLSFLGQKKLPVCVDLDGTLLAGNSLAWLWKQYQAQQKISPIRILCPRWAAFKQKLTRETSYCVTELPFRLPLLKELRMLQKQNVSLFLLTGADQKLATEVADHLNIFEEAWGSNGRTHFVGFAKRAYAVRRFGILGYTYLGDSWRDIPVWKSAKNMVIIGGSPLLINCMQYLCSERQALCPYPIA